MKEQFKIKNGKKLSVAINWLYGIYLLALAAVDFYRGQFQPEYYAFGALYLCIFMWFFFWALDSHLSWRTIRMYRRFLKDTVAVADDLVEENRKLRRNLNDAHGEIMNLRTALEVAKTTSEIT